MTSMFQFTSEQEMIIASIDRWASREKARDCGDAISRSLARWREMGELGWIGAGLSSELGGFGGNVADECLIAMRLAQALAPAPYRETVIAVHLLADLGNAPDLAGSQEPVIFAAGDCRLGASGQSIAATKSSAGWLLSGRLTNISEAPLAGSFLISAFAPEEDQPLLFEISAATAGIQICAYEAVDGRPAGDLLLDEVCVAAEQQRGAGDAVAIALQHAYFRSRVLLCAEVCGLLEGALRLTTDYLKTRRQFGHALADFQALQHRLADMFVEMRLAKAALWRGATSFENGDRLAETIDAMSLQVLKAGKFVCGQAIQLHGAIGLTEEYSVGHYLKRLVAIEALLGGYPFILSRLSAALQAQAAESL